jgi:L-aspartate oxidase
VGHLYAVTTNPPQANGAGVALAAEAGAIIADAEFVQFHPTALDVGRDPAPLATEALRGDGATLVDSDGVRFMATIHPGAELAPRDIVARGVFASIAAGKGAFLDCREAIGAEFAERFPTVHAACRAAGIDPVTQPIPVAPAEHYHMGGVWTDARGRTSVAGLWAAGEVASTGVHGANRLASNSLLEAIVFAARIAEDLASVDLVPPKAELRQPLVAIDSRVASPVDDAAVASLRDIMSRLVGVIRNGAGLAEACLAVAAIRAGAQDAGLRNMATTALFIAAAALARQESRGGHFRSDWPQARDALARRSRLTLADVERIVAGLARPLRRAGGR